MKERFERGSRVCVVPRPALTDLMAVSGAVRHLADRGVHVMVVVHKRHASSVPRLYMDAGTGVRFTFVDDWDADGQPPAAVMDGLQAKGYAVVHLHSVRDACPCAALGVSAGKARAAFRVSSDRAADDLLDRIVQAVGPTFVVVHDAGDRRIRRQLLPQGLPVVDVRDPAWRTPSIFDWAHALGQAAELHAIDSCFVLMAEAMSLRARRVLHAYASPPGRRVAHHHGTTLVYA